MLIKGNVPTKNKTNRALGRWVSTQRSNYKKFQAGSGILRPKTDRDETVRRIRRLNGIGFQWSLLPGSGSSVNEQEHDENSDETDQPEESDDNDDADEGDDSLHRFDDSDDGDGNNISPSNITGV
jgi:hypothetical protein